MSNSILPVIVDIVRELAYVVVYLASGVVAYLTLQRPKVQEWLQPAGGLVRVVAFLALTVLVEWPFGYIVSDLFSFLDALVGRNPLVYPGVRCLGGMVALIALTVGIVLVARDSDAKTEEG
jgi:hypothetical protein